jgi:hypothetical protein
MKSVRNLFRIGLVVAGGLMLGAAAAPECFGGNCCTVVQQNGDVCIYDCGGPWILDDCGKCWPTGGGG